MEHHFGLIRFARRPHTQLAKRILARRRFRSPARPRPDCHKMPGIRKLRQSRTRPATGGRPGFVAPRDRAAPGAWSAAAACRADRAATERDMTFSFWG